MLVQKRAGAFFSLILILMMAACSPAASEQTAAVTEAPAVPSATPIVRQPQGETLVFTAGTAIFTVPNPDGRWEVRSLQGDRLASSDENETFNIRLSAVRNVEDFQAEVNDIAGDNDVQFSESDGRAYAIVQRTAGPEYFVDAGENTIIVATFTVPPGATITAPTRQAALETILQTTVAFIE
ncbi:MAG: hypothetical protein KC496_20470 [Anaerolineae bacterium]|nr:hypothetical protein [Anaerolineae bacterium]